MAQTIQLKRTTSVTPPPMTLAPGELSVEVGPGPTRVWLGDGAVNRLLLSSAPADNPIAGSGFVHLTGDQMSGFLTLVADPRIDHPLDAATKQYVDAAAGLTGTYRGLYDPTTNTPDISGGDTVNQANYIVSVTGNMSTAVAGIAAGTPMTQGDRVIWSQDLAIWTHLAGGGGGAGLDKPTADTFYVNVVGDIMTGNLIMQAPRTVVLGANPAAAMEAVPLQFLQTQLSGFLPLTGGVVTGAVSFAGASATLTLAQNPAGPLEAATKQYVDGMGFPEAPTAIGPYGRLGPPSRSWVRAVAVGGDTITGTLNVATGANINYQGNGNGQTAAAPVTLTSGPWVTAPIAFAWDGTGKLRWKVGGVDGGTIPGGDLSGAVGFPEAPADGQIYGRQGSTTSWQPVSSTVSTDTFPPAAPTDGMLWWDADSGQLFIRYDDGNSQQWVQANTGVAGGGSVAFPIPIVQGGTGQTDAAAALNALNGLSRNGGTMNGQLILSGPPQSGLAAVTRDYVDGYLPRSGGVSFPMTGPLYTNGGGPPNVAISFSTAANVGLYGTTTTVGISTGGQPRLVADSAGVTVNGTITGSGTLQLGVSAADAAVDLRKAAGAFNNIIYGRTGNSARWQLILGSSVAESGSNVGSDFAVNRFGDNGVYIDTPLVIARTNGTATMRALDIQPGGGQWAQVTLTSPAGNRNRVVGQRGTSFRWEMVLGNEVAEGGSNAGSDFGISSFTDAGAFLASPLTINRATGNTQVLYLGIKPASGPAMLVMTGTTNQIFGFSSSNTQGRWMMQLGDATAETGGNAGSDFDLHRYSDAGAYLGTAIQVIRSSGACWNQTGTWLAMSDERVKRDIAPYERGLADLIKLNPVMFKYNGEYGTVDDDQQQYGMVAQEVESIVPEVVTVRSWSPMPVEGEEPVVPVDVLGVDSGRLMYAVINAFKEVEARLKALEAV